MDDHIERGREQARERESERERERERDIRKENTNKTPAIENKDCLY